MKISNNYINYGYSSFLHDWQKYYNSNFLTFSEEVERLKVGLDSESKNTIDNFIDIIIHKLKLPNNKYLIKENYIYSNSDKKIIKKERLSNKEIIDFRDKYIINNDYILQTSVFRYHNGLKLLPKSTQQTIKNKVIIDAGAYYGDSSLVFTKYKPKKIYAFEPCSVNFKSLKETIVNNNLEKIIFPIKMGLHEFNGLYKLSYNSSNRPNLGAKIIQSLKNFKKQELVNLVTIDSFVSDHNLHDITAIKLDIEGLELEAVLGAKNTIKKYKPVLLIAIYHNAEEFLNIKPILESFNCNYKFLIRSLDTLDILKEIYLIAYIPY